MTAYAADLAAGYGEAPLPHAYVRKHPGAARQPHGHVDVRRLLEPPGRLAHQPRSHARASRTPQRHARKAQGGRRAAHYAAAAAGAAGAGHTVHPTSTGAARPGAGRKCAEARA